jgi:hypothetical protein
MTTYEQLSADIRQAAVANLTAQYGDSSALREARLHAETLDVTEQLDPDTYPILSQYGASAQVSYTKNTGEYSSIPKSAYIAQFSLSFEGDMYRRSHGRTPEDLAALGDLVTALGFLKDDGQSIKFVIPAENTGQVITHKDEYRYPSDSVAEHALEEMDDTEYEEFGGDNNRGVLVSLAERASDALHAELHSAFGTLVVSGIDGLEPTGQLVAVFDNFQALRDKPDNNR